MTVLGIDSAGKQAGVAVWRDERVWYECVLNGGNTHSETLLGMVQDALRRTRLTLDDIDCIGVNAGPGSFTGLRIGLAAVKGLALQRDIPCAGVSTLESLAQSCVLDGTVLCALDARRSEVYWAAFTVQNGTVTRLTPDAAQPAAALEDFLQTLPSPVYVMGDGAQVVLQALPGANLQLYPAPYTAGRAFGVCRAAQKAYDEGKTQTALTLAPEYHRLSQAQRERQEREAKQL